MGRRALPGTELLTEQGDFAEKMVAGMNALLLRETFDTRGHRIDHWNRDTSSLSGNIASAEPNGVRFSAMIGVVDPRE